MTMEKMVYKKTVKRKNAPFTFTNRPDGRSKSM